MKKTNKHTALGLSLGLCLGCGLGLCFGMTLFDNLALGMCCGMGIGIALGTAIGASRDAAISKQLEEKGYTVKSVEKKDGSENFAVVITDKFGGEKKVTVPKDTMAAEQFKVGDAVYLDENNFLEKAFGDEADEDKQPKNKKQK